MKFLFTFALKKTLIGIWSATSLNYPNYLKTTTDYLEPEMVEITFSLSISYVLILFILFY